MPEKADVLHIKTAALHCEHSNRPLQFVYLFPLGTYFKLCQHFDKAWSRFLLDHEIIPRRFSEIEMGREILFTFIFSANNK